MRKRHSLSPEHDRRLADTLRARAKSREPKLSREWIREIERRLRDSRDPVRYMLVSEFGRNFILYYDVSDDVFAMNAPDRGTLFKRREAAERVCKTLSQGVRIVKFTTSRGKLRRLSPFRGPSWARQQPNSRSNGRATGATANRRSAPARRSPRRWAAYPCKSRR